MWKMLAAERQLEHCLAQCDRDVVNENRRTLYTGFEVSRIRRRTRSSAHCHEIHGYHARIYKRY